MANGRIPPQTNPNADFEDKTIEIIWKCWYGPEKIKLDFPSNWPVRTISMNNAKATTNEEIKTSILFPLSTPPLRQLAKGKLRPIIIIDDLHRPTETYKILPVLLEELSSGGIREEQIDILVSLGAHRPMSGGEINKKIGEDMTKRVKVYNHNPYENLVNTGTTSRGTPLKINRFLAESDLKILVGSVIPHPYAGFGGGAKLILPGLASIDAIEINHKPSYGHVSGVVGRIDGNERRDEIEEAGRMVGIDFAINTISNSEGKTAGIFSGNLFESYNAAVKFARKVYATDVPYNLDIGIFNAFPKDNGIIQSFNSLNVWSTRSANRQIVKPGGSIVIITNCPDGVGYHGLADRGMRLYVRRDKHGTFKDILSKRKIIYFSPNLIPRDLHDFLPKTTLLFTKWNQVVEELKKTHSRKCKTGVFPCSPLQIDNNIQ
jgi:nickel-dependent lactate racemase